MNSSHSTATVHRIDDCQKPAVEMSRWVLQTLNDRFEEVITAFTPAVEHADEDPEFIHELRVACRRMVAALRFFAPVLPAGKSDRLISRLQRLRKAAGDARDIDVMRERILSGDLPLKTKQRKRMLRFLKRKRNKARKPIVRMQRKLDGTTRLVALFEAMCARFANQNSVLRFDPLERRNAAIRDYRKYLSVEPTSADALHRLRIAGKELRYTLELTREFEPVDVVDRILKRFRKLQDRLGRIVDYEASRQRLKNWKKKSKRRQTRTVLARLAKRERREWRSASRRFHRWWTRKETNKLQSELRNALVDRSPVIVQIPLYGNSALPETESRP